MRKSRFTTEQIIGFIKQAKAGMAVSELAWQHGFSPPASTPGGPSTAAWRPRTPSASRNWSRRTATRIAGKCGPQPKIAQQLQQIEALTKAKQRAISQVLDSVLAAHQ